MNDFAERYDAKTLKTQDAALEEASMQELKADNERLTSALYDMVKDQEKLADTLVRILAPSLDPVVNSALDAHFEENFNIRDYSDDLRDELSFDIDDHESDIRDVVADVLRNATIRVDF